MMMSSPNSVGLRTSTAASRTTSTLRPAAQVAVGDVADAVLDHDDRAIDDHAEVDGPEADSRLAAMPNRNMPEKANSIDSGMASATMAAARRLPRNANRTAMTSSPPSNRFLRTVSMTRSTSSVRS